MRRVRLGSFVLMCTVACAERAPGDAAVVAAVIEPETPKEPPRVVAPPIPEERRCGEAGATPTALPPVVASGRRTVGEAKLHSGDAKMFGTVSVAWNANAWIGSRGSGHRGDAIVVRIDQAEANGGPWGADEEIRAEHQTQMTVGPYRFDVRMSAAPIEVDVVVTRNACPEHGVIEKTTLPLSFWVSSEATRVQTYDMHGVMLQVIASSRARGAQVGVVPQIEVSALGWKQSFDPIPTPPLRLRARDLQVTIDEVIEAPVTGGGKGVHARVRIEAAKPRVDPPRGIATGCGAATTRATTVPPRLLDPPPVVGDIHLSVGEEVTHAGIDLTIVRDDENDFTTLQMRGDDSLTPSALTFMGSHARMQIARSKAGLLRVEPSGVDELRVRLLKIACPHALELPTITEPTFVWLSTIGHAQISVGPTTSPLTVQLYADDLQPSLSASSGHAYYSRGVTPAIVGDVHTLDGLELEVVDVQSNPGTRFDTRWSTPNAMPGVHVLLRIAPR